MLSVIFIVCLEIRAMYFTYLESVVNKLKDVDDLHIKHHRINKKFQFSHAQDGIHRRICWNVRGSKDTCTFLELEIVNNLATTLPAYYRAVIFILYLIMSLESRFTDSNESLLKEIFVHSSTMKNTKKDIFAKAVKKETISVS